MAQLANIHMASDLTEWTSTTISSPNTLVYSAGSGQAGTTGAALLGINSSTNATYMTKTHTALSTETDYRFRFYMNNFISGITLPSGHNIDLWRPYSNGNTVQRGYGRIHNNSGTLQLIHSIRLDDNSFPTETITWGTMPSYIEVHMHKGSGTAFQKVYFDGVLMGTGITGVTVSTVFIYDALRLGAPQISSAGTVASMVFDEVVIRNDATVIGSANAAPTVTDISNQTGTFGTPKSVACTLNAGTSAIARCDVSTNGTALITLTASGAAVVTNNGTTAPYVTGSSTDVLATLGNNISFSGVRNGTELSHVETITVLVTDALSATGNDTFTLTWSVPTGVGTQTLYLTGTHAQLNAALPTVEFTGTVVETIQCLMYSVTSTPLTDTDMFNIVVSEQQVTGSLPSLFIVNVRRRRRR